MTEKRAKCDLDLFLLLNWGVPVQNQSACSCIDSEHTPADHPSTSFIFDFLSDSRTVNGAKCTHADTRANASTNLMVLILQLSRRLST